MIDPLESQSQLRPVAHWLQRLIYALMISLLTISLLILFAIGWDTFLNPAPIRITEISQSPAKSLCPGDYFNAVVHVDIQSPMLLYIYFTVLDETGSYNIPDTQTNLPPQQQPKKASFNETLFWQVPNLPTGNYIRSIFFRGLKDDQKTAFLATPFTIGENCGKANSNH